MYASNLINTANYNVTQEWMRYILDPKMDELLIEQISWCMKIDGVV
jgi:hypothetical protein